MTITPAAGFVTPGSAMIMGAIGAVSSYSAMMAVSALGFVDDTLDVFACHGVGGIMGALLNGVFATKAVNPAGVDGLLYGNLGLLKAQAIAVLGSALLSIVGTATIMLVLRAIVDLRVEESDLERGIDALEHGESAYATRTSP